MRAQAPSYDGRVPNLLNVARNPIAYIAARWTPTQRTLQRATLFALVMAVVIIVTGGAVRLTGSGLGCNTWPKCSADSLVATSEMGIHGKIEFYNRMLTWVLCAAVGWAIIAARAAKPTRPQVARLAWAQFWVVMVNAVLGGISVLVKLNPYVVAGHFLAAVALLTVAVLTWQRSREGDDAPRPLVGKPVRQLGMLLLAATGALVAVGTVVTGSGPHPGDNSHVPRMPVDWQTIAQLHADLAWAVVALSLAIWLVLRAVDAPAGPRARTRELVIVLLAQGGIGYVQYFTDVPEVLVAVHMLGASLVWVAVLRVLLALRERGLPPEPAAAPDAAVSSDTGPAITEPEAAQRPAPASR
jgi:cytochrome c oxidase assembly protein subunit 15